MKRYREHYVYKYTNLLTGRIVYIGKTNCSLKARIDAHKREASFLAYSDLYVEFTMLSNEVETDAVEKVLINYYKPAINIKDKVCFLTETVFLPDLIWYPYRVYLAEIETGKFKKHQIALKTAQIDTEFLYDCLSCREDGGSFISTHLHPNGLLPFPSGYRKVTLPFVKNEPDGYLQFLQKGVLSEILSNENRIMMNIWMPVVQQCNLSERAAQNIELYEKALEFSKLARWFSYQGYRMNDDSELCVLKVPVALKPVLSMFGKTDFEEWNENIYLEWGDDDHLNLEQMDEDIAGVFVTILKSLGIIEYGFSD